MGNTSPSGEQWFAPLELARLMALKIRYEHGAFRDPGEEVKRLEFARWLVERGRLNEGISPERRRQFLFWHVVS